MKYFIDFEANSPTNEIIEIGCVSESGETFRTYVKPTTKIDSFIVGLTHITNEMVADAPTIDIAILNLYEWMLSTSKSIFLWKDTTIYCYGNGDYNFLNCSAKTCNKNDSFMILASLGMCLKDFTKKVNYFFKDQVSLIQALNYFKTNNNVWIQKHNALDDALALKELYEILPKNYSLQYSPFIIKTEKGIRKSRKETEYTDYANLTEATECIVKQILIASPNCNVKPENVRKRIINAINKKSSYMGYKWKYKEENK